MSRVSAPLVGQGEAASVALHLGMGEQGQGSGGAVFSQEQVNGRAVQRLALLTCKERLAGQFHLAGLRHAQAGTSGATSNGRATHSCYPWFASIKRSTLARGKVFAVAVTSASVS